MNQSFIDDINAVLEKHNWKHRFGDPLKKKSGSEWHGIVRGIYMTEQTPEGYGVESGAHKNTVQIYPEVALIKEVILGYRPLKDELTDSN